MVLRNKHIMIDLGTGNNNKINWAMEDKQEMIDIVETIYRFNTDHESLIPYHTFEQNHDDGKRFQFQGGKERPRSCGVTQGLLDQIPLLKSRHI